MITPANIEQAAEAAHQLSKRLSQLRGYYMNPKDEPATAPHIAALERSALREFAVLAGAMGDSSFQSRTDSWMAVCFGPEIAADRRERNHRFLEEALELVQAGRCTASEAHQLVDYVFGRPVGEKDQEVGGVIVTLSALCSAHNLDMNACGETELERIWQNVERIRAKHAAKPKHSPLPGSAPETLEQ